MKSETVFVTDNLKLAGAMTAAGFALLHVDWDAIDEKDEYGRPSRRNRIFCELKPSHNGVDANYLQLGFENEPAANLEERVNEIIKTRGLTPEEIVILTFDAARAGIHNQLTIYYCAKNNKPLIAKKIGGDRTLIYREGTPKTYVENILNNA